MELLTKRRLEKVLDGYIASKVPRDLRGEVRLAYAWSAEGLALYEERPDYERRCWDRTRIAQLRPSQQGWDVYAPAANEDWATVCSIAPHPDFEAQLEQIELDREGLFWIS
ncbi:DUF3024 domain-containing protein [Paenibacillus sp. IB182496]|uniref:DUF3024 domain-containing protein n=1 Tax=Paenibacillus sabuli TaxID=2772509 RepID=A0A927BTQ2_9BACL|nr:DUF3024 domain-containing protein [Paenibacillus sabuli]MBD2845349.1 DUF3024 domain-containing protein [Paenibacillus sabuli]